MSNNRDLSLNGDKNSKKDLDNLIPNVPIRKFVNSIFNILEDAKAEEVSFIDTKGRSNISDYLIICQGNSQPHCSSIAKIVEYKLKKKGYNFLGIEGENEGNWALLDYGEIILHVFHPEIRKYYDLEGLYNEHFSLDLEKN